MKDGHVTALPPEYYDSVTNMPRTMVTTPTQVVGTNTTFLKALIGNKTHYYPNFQIFFYLLNHINVLTCFDANYCIILSVILTHSHS